MGTEYLADIFSKNSERNAVIWNDRIYSYAWLLERIDAWKMEIHRKSIQSGAITAIHGDFSPNSVALFFALLQHDCVVVPISSSATADITSKLIVIGQVEFIFSVNIADEVTITHNERKASHPLLQELRRRSHAGLVLFSSGSTGTMKAAVHDLLCLLRRFETPRHPMRTIPFLLFDHIGGVNTMLHVICNGGCLVIVQERTPDAVLAAVEKYRVELLPTSPTFINLILISEAYHRHDLSSLRTISYGTEPMPEYTLKRLHQLFPGIQLVQTYGLSELGILHSKSRSSDSLWVKIGGTGFETRIVNGTLEVKAESAMLGYMNASSPFTEDGWFRTEDAVEVDGEFIRILGRQSEVINVGGQKVFPAEVESVVGELDNVAEVTIYPEKNAILGEIVCANVRLKSPEEPNQCISHIKYHCRQKLAPFKVPVKVAIGLDPLHTSRFKKRRTSPALYRK